MTPPLPKIRGPSTSAQPIRPAQPIQPRKILPLGDPPTPQAPVSSVSTPPGARQVLRVNRACNACRKQKMRCEGPDNPPCARCRASGVQCVFEKVQRPDPPDANSQRITELEGRWSTIEGSISEVLRELRDVRSRLDNLGTAGSHPHPHQHPSTPIASGPSLESVPSSATTASPGHGHDGRPSSAGNSMNSLPPIEHMLSNPNSHRRDSPLHHGASVQYPMNLPPPTPSSSSHPHLPHSFQSYPLLHLSASSSTRLQGNHQYVSSSLKRKAGAIPSSAVNSANNSGDEGDDVDLPSAALSAPISVLTKMASAHADASGDEASSIFESSGEENEDTGAGPTRRRRSTTIRSHQPSLRRSVDPGAPSPHWGVNSLQSPPLTAPHYKRKRRASSPADQDGGTSRTRFKAPDGVFDMRSPDGIMSAPGYRGARSSFTAPEGSVSSTGSRSRRPIVKRELDVVEQGLVTEDEAKELYNIYFSGCHRLLAVFDPKVDTYVSIKERSPFLLCALLMVGAKVRDGAKVDSDTQKKLMGEATRLAKDRVFDLSAEASANAEAGIADVQALLLMAGWSHTMRGVGWLTAGHAIRVAVELGLNKALLRLERRKLANKNTDNDRMLVVAARTWLALYVFEYQISFGTGRPAMMRADAAITTAKAFLLTHPLSLPTDARLVSTCDLLTRQSIIHDNLERKDESGDDQYVIQVLKDATKEIDSWLEEWDQRMSASQPTEGFFRSSAAIQRSYANLFHDCIALKNIATVEDARSISPEMREVAMQAVSAAKECINICLNNGEYREGLRYAVAYTHTCAAFAGAFLLRFARLFPEDVDLDESTRMVESLAAILNEVPAQRFAVCLRKMLSHTKVRVMRNQVLQQNQDNYGLVVSKLEEGDSLGRMAQGERQPDIYAPFTQDLMPTTSSSASAPHPPTHQYPLPHRGNSSVNVGAPQSVDFSALGITAVSPRSQQFTNNVAHLVNPSPNMPPTATGASSFVAPPPVGAFQNRDGAPRANASFPAPANFGFDEAPFFESTMGTVLEGFFGDGHDWAPWISTSIAGDLGMTARTPLSVDLNTPQFPFSWNPPNQLPP